MEIDTRNLMRDLMGLALTVSKVSAHFYDTTAGTKNTKYRENLPGAHELEFHAAKDSICAPFASEETNAAIGRWLISSEQKISHVAAYTYGNSATVRLGKKENGELCAIRAVEIAHNQPHGNQQRLNSPLVLQPFQNAISYFEQTGADPAGLPIKSTVMAEILLFVPVLPNGLASIEMKSGHSTFKPDKLLVPGISQDEEALLEGRKLTYAALLRASGFTINRVSDLGIRPDGKLVFVDPDVLQCSGNLQEAHRRFNHALGMIGLKEVLSPLSL